MVQDAEDANTIHLYEVYTDEAAFQAHTSAPHFLRMRETTADWREGQTVHRGANIAPSDEEWA